MMIIDQKEKNISYLVNIALKKKSKKGDFQKQFSHEEKHLLKEKKKNKNSRCFHFLYFPECNPER